MKIKRFLCKNMFDIVIGLLCIVICIMTIYPIYYTLIASISRPLLVDNGDVIFLPKGINFESYKRAFSTHGIWKAYANTIYYTVVGTAVSMVISSTMAYSLSRRKLRGRKIYTLLVVFTMWFNPGIIPIYQNFKDLHILNTRFVIIVGFALSAYNIIILKSFFEQLPASLEEAAFIDGASTIKIYAKIFLPLSKPALATVGMFYAVGRWNGYFWAMTTIKDDSKMPVQVLLRKLIVETSTSGDAAALVTQSSMSSPTTIIYALIMIAMLPMLLVYPFIQKFFKAGLTLGAVKG